MLWKPNTIEEFANAVKGFTAAFPDQHYTFQYIVAGELYGYSSGPLCWRSLTGRKFSVGELDIIHIEESRTVEHGDPADAATMAR